MKHIKMEFMLLTSPSYIRLSYKMMIACLAILILMACSDAGSESAATSFGVIVTSPDNFVLAENTIIVGTITTINAQGAVNFSVTGGTDQSSFIIDQQQHINFINMPDFENPADSDKNNIYDVEVTATDIKSTATTSISIKIINLENEAPIFISGNTATMTENSTLTGYIANATDVDGDKLTYSITGGSDQTNFILDADTGVLSFQLAPDYEVPADSDANNIYEVQIIANDGTNITNNNVMITVTDLFDLNIASAGVKELDFSWTGYDGADFYRLLVNKDGTSGYTVVQDNIQNTSARVSIAVHLTDWVNSTYILEAHSSATPLASTPAINITPFMLGSIRSFRASNSDERDEFGWSVALSADSTTMAVGAWRENSASVGVNGNQINDCNEVSPSNCAKESGAVYIYRYNAALGWQQKAYIKASNTESREQFGSSVALSSDGNTLAVGAMFENSAAAGTNGNQIDDCGATTPSNCSTTSGAVYIFRYDETLGWEQQTYIKSSNADTEEGDRFGSSLALSADGNTLAVGAYLEDSAATGINGNQVSDCGLGALNCENLSGAVFLYRYDTIFGWRSPTYIKASNANLTDYFGWSLSLSADGNTLAVGAFLEDSAATNINGNQINDCEAVTQINCAKGSGAAYIFYYDQTTGWQQKAYIKAFNPDSGDHFGESVALSADGNILAVGATRESSGSFRTGAVYLYRFDSTLGWQPSNYIIANSNNDAIFFGSTLALSNDGNTLAVGAPFESSAATGINDINVNDCETITPSNCLINSGAVFVFQYNKIDSWKQMSYVKSSKTTEEAQFGTSLSLNANGNVLIVGSPIYNLNNKNTGTVFLY